MLPQNSPTPCSPDPRERIALALILLFALLVGGALFLNENLVLTQALTFVASLLAMIIGYYFRRPGG